VSVQYATRKPWVPSSVRISFWAFEALGRKRGRWDLAVRIVGAAESRRLNHRYRRKDRPTNVLSFPASVRALTAHGRSATWWCVPLSSPARRASRTRRWRSTGRT